MQSVTKKEFNFFWNNCNQLLKGYLKGQADEEDNNEEEVTVNGKYSIYNNECIMNNDYSFLKFKLKTSIPWCVTLDGIEFYKQFKDLKKDYNDGFLNQNGFTFSIMDAVTNAPKSYNFRFDERSFNSWKLAFNKLVIKTFTGMDCKDIFIDLDEKQVEFLSKAKVFVMRIDKKKNVSFDLSYDPEKGKYLMQNRFSKNILMKINSGDKVSVQLNIVNDNRMNNFLRFAFHVDTKNYEYWQYFKIVNIE